MNSLSKLYFFLLFYLPVVLLHAQVKSSIQNPKVPTVFDTTVDFSGWKGATLNYKQLREIRIGFFAPDKPDDPIGGPMVNGASLAIEEANEGGGFYGIPYCLVKRWSNDPWRAGSKEMVRLVYQDSVWAVIGSFNGSATHIAEQVATKARIPLLSPVSADPTLTYIRIPWIFRLPPDDKIQAQMLVQEGIQALSLHRIGIITSADHDGRIFARKLLVSMKAEEMWPVFHFKISSKNIDYKRISERIKLFKSDGLILRLTLEENLCLLDHFQRNGFRIPVFIPWIPGLPYKDLIKHYDGPIVYVLPFTQAGNPLFSSFAKYYIKRFGISPNPGAAYVYDAIHIVIQSLKKSGLNRAKLRDSIAKIDRFKGVTGNISWDNGGGNKAGSCFTILYDKKTVNNP